MFSTIFQVQQKKISGSIVFTAYFESLDEAKKFAEDTVAKINDKFIYSKEKHLDGSFLEQWVGDFNEVTLDDESWLTDFCTNGVRFMPLGLEFETYEHFKKHILRTQQIAKI